MQHSNSNHWFVLTGSYGEFESSFSALEEMGREVGFTWHEHEVKLEAEVWWAPRVFPRDEGPSGEVVTAVAYVCTSGEHKGHGWVWRHGTEGLWFLVSMNQQCHTASPTALSLMSIQSIPNRAPFIATFCCMGRDNSLQYSPQLKKKQKTFEVVLLEWRLKGMRGGASSSETMSL